MKKVSKCPTCGAPIYALEAAKDVVPDIKFTCACRIGGAPIYIPPYVPAPIYVRPYWVRPPEPVYLQPYWGTGTGTALPYDGITVTNAPGMVTP